MSATKTPAGKIVELAPGIRRVLAPNPSPMTYTGTNTYLVGNRDLAVIDPGPPDEAHLQAILGALEGHQRISHILVTHAHIDHSPLAMVLAQLVGAKVHGFGPANAGRSAVMAGLEALEGGEGVDQVFLPDVTLADGAVVEGSDWKLRALHTPGHMGNHLCFDLLGAEGTRSGHLFSGDLVMGWATSMVSPPDGDLTDFMASLARLSAMEGHQVFYPGHGDPIESPDERLAELTTHRQMREAQILSALQDAPGSAAELAARIYTDLDPALLPAAARNVLAHLIALVGDSRARTEGPISASSVFHHVP